MSGREDRPAREREREAPGDEPFFSRWARLKKESRDIPAGDATDGAAPPAALTPDDGAAGDEQAPAAANAEAAEDQAAAPSLELPPLESLTAESDFSAFMQPGVDSTLRSAALRKMWQNPIYGVVDDLDPFRADFAAFTPLGDIITSDMKFHAERLLREQLEKAVGDADSAGSASGEPTASGPAEDGGDDEAQDESTTSTEDADERRDT